MRSAFSHWLARHLEVTASRVAEARRLEAHYGDLDRLYDRDRFASLLEELAYSKDDERSGRPNPARFPIDGVVWNSLKTYRSTLRYYARFRAEEDRLPRAPSRRWWQRLLRPAAVR
jgi:hypothetical protein